MLTKKFFTGILQLGHPVMLAPQSLKPQIPPLRGGPFTRAGEEPSKLVGLRNWEEQGQTG